jgi:hypothetical protein
MLFDESLFSAKCYLFGRKIHLFCPFLPENFYTSFEAAFLQNRRHMSLQRVKKRLRHFFKLRVLPPLGFPGGKTRKERKPHGFHPAFTRVPSEPKLKSRTLGQSRGFLTA